MFSHRTRRIQLQIPLQTLKHASIPIMHTPAFIIERQTQEKFQRKPKSRRPLKFLLIAKPSKNSKYTKAFVLDPGPSNLHVIQASGGRIARPALRHNFQHRARNQSGVPSDIPSHTPPCLVGTARFFDFARECSNAVHSGHSNGWCRKKELDKGRKTGRILFYARREVFSQA